MKTKFFTVLFLSFAWVITGQNYFVCLTESLYNDENSNNYTYSIDSSIYQNADPIVFNVYFWQVREPDGTYVADFNQTILLEGIAELNKTFNEFNIFFKYRGFDGFDSPTGIIEEIWNPVTKTCDEIGPDPDGWGKISRCQRYDMWNYAVANGYYKPDAINIYLPYQITDVGGAASVNNNIFRLLVSVGSVKRPVVYHELGHVFGLNHTNLGWTLPSNQNSQDYPCEGCEHVTRDLNNPDYNADCRGDQVHDTNAVPDFYREHLQELLDAGVDPEVAYQNFEPFKYVDPETCYYSGSGKDCINESYQINTDDTRNIMLNASNCSSLIFTPGQGVRMQERIQNNLSYYQIIMTDVSTLYEPYAGVYNIPGTVIEYNPAKFQPGFDYEFLKCFPSGGYPLPSDYTDTSFYYWGNGIWVDAYDKDIDPSMYNTIIHKDGTTIRIVQLEQQPRKCWNTGQGSLIGGAVVRFNDGVLNTNVTITPQDSTAINNPQLIDNLQPGLYNIIKTFENGNSQENLILKENN